MSYLNWHVGMKVECINGTFGDRNHPRLMGCQWPEIGVVYTIRSIGFATASYGKGVIIWLEEIHNPSVKFRDLPEMEMAFAASFFRPVQTRKTSIEVFTRMLNHQKQGADA